MPVIPHHAPILVVKEPWITLLLNGQKSMEIRNSACRRQLGSVVYLAPSGTKHVVGHVTFDGSARLSQQDWSLLRSHHLVQDAEMPYGNSTHAWSFVNPVRFDEPIGYNVKKGSIVWRKYESAGEGNVYI